VTRTRRRHRVAGEVQQRAPQLNGVGPDRDAVGGLDRHRRATGRGGEIADLVEERAQRDRLQPRRGPASELEELVDHRLQVSQLALDAPDLVEALGLVGERVAQQPRVQLQSTQRVAHLVSDPGEHHLRALVARAQRGARLFQCLRQHADLVARLDRDRRLQIPAAQPRRGLGQPRHRPRDPARQPDGQQQDSQQRNDGGAEQRPPERRQHRRVIGVALDRHDAADVARFAHDGVRALVRDAVVSHEQRRRRRCAAQRARDLGAVGVQLVGVRAQRDRRRRVAACLQIRRHRQHAPHAQAGARRLQPPADARVRQRILVSRAERPQLLGQQRRRRAGRGGPQPPAELILERAPRDLVREEAKQPQRRDRRHDRPREQPQQEPP
jgi:hypothetical protein